LGRYGHFSSSSPTGTRLARRLLGCGSNLSISSRVADDEHVEVETTWGIYQHVIAAYRDPYRKRGRELMQQLIGSISHSAPAALREAFTLPFLSTS
jgi:hypothetical protein